MKASDARFRISGMDFFHSRSEIYHLTYDKVSVSSGRFGPRSEKIGACTHRILTHSGFRKRVWFEFPSHHFSSEYLGSKFSFHYRFRSRPFLGILVSNSRSRLLGMSSFSFPSHSLTPSLTGRVSYNCFCYLDEI